MGPGIVKSLDGSEESAARMRTILEQQQGSISVEEACRRLGVQKSRYAEMVRLAYQGMRAALEPRPAGRPAGGEDPLAEEIEELEEENRTLKMMLHRESVRLELARAMPHVLKDRPLGPGDGSKKAIGGGIPPASARADHRATIRPRLRRPIPVDGPRILRNLHGSIRNRSHRRQAPARQAEHRARFRTLAYLRLSRRWGGTLAEVAREIGVAATTIRSWEKKRNAKKLAASPRGRRILRSPRDRRQEVIRYIHKKRYRRLTLASIRRKFPDVSREILSDLLARGKHAWARRRAGAEELSWTAPGVAWTADYTEADFPIDGIYRYVLVVKDLGSGFTLAAVPARSESAKVFVETLARLFLWLGIPLVLKTDNGSAFRARKSRRLLARRGILQLLSPPYYPRYNGAIEASIGAIKERIMDAAFGEGDPFRWTESALREAVRIGNDSPKWNAKDATPRELFQSRAGVSRTRRATFIHSFRRLRAEERLRRYLLPEARPNKSVRAAIVRSAIRRALEACGILVVSRRRISPGVSS